LATFYTIFAPFSFSNITGSGFGGS